MSNVVSFNSYKLQAGVSVADYLLAVETMTKEFASKQKGWISSKTMVDKDVWADFTVFESADALQAFAEAFHDSEIAKACFSFMDFGSMKSHVFTVEQSFN